MNTIKKILIACALVVSLGAAATAVAGTRTGMEGPINETIQHIQDTLSAIEANDLEVAQEHIKGARQASKQIFGGTLASKAQRGADAIVNARAQVKDGKTGEAKATLKEALEVYKGLLSLSEV